MHESQYTDAYIRQIADDYPEPDAEGLRVAFDDAQFAGRAEYFGLIIEASPIGFILTWPGGHVERVDWGFDFDEAIDYLI